ncbi:MAG: ABC transporter permease [archaeon]
MNPSVRRIFATVRRFFRILFRSNSRKIEFFYDPIVLLVTWGFFFITFRNSPIAAIFFSSSILWHLSYSFQSTFNLLTLEDIWNDCFKELMIIPLRLWEYLVSKFIASFLRNALKVGIMVFLAALFFDYSVFAANPGKYLLVVAELFLLATAIAIIIDAIILVGGREAQSIAWSANSLIVLFSCPYYPAEILPAVFQPIARLSPYFIPFQQMKELVASGNYSFSLPGIALPIVFYLSVAIILFIFSIRRARRDGSLARF